MNDKILKYLFDIVNSVESIEEFIGTETDFDKILAKLKKRSHRIDEAVDIANLNAVALNAISKSCTAIQK